MVEKAGGQDVKIDFETKTVTCTVPAAVTDEMIEQAVVGKFSAKVQN